MLLEVKNALLTILWLFFKGFILFYLIWDIDVIFKAKVSTERKEDDRHLHTLYIGSKKAIGFRYTFLVSVKDLPWGKKK